MINMFQYHNYFDRLFLWSKVKETGTLFIALSTIWLFVIKSKYYLSINIY